MSNFIHLMLFHLQKDNAVQITKICFISIPDAIPVIIVRKCFTRVKIGNIDLKGKERQVVYNEEIKMTIKK